jgi:hypothetical protein
MEIKQQAHHLILIHGSVMILYGKINIYTGNKKNDIYKCYHTHSDMLPKKVQTSHNKRDIAESFQISALRTTRGQRALII